MRVFYRGPRVLITREAISVAQLTPRSFALAELRGVHIVRQQLPGNSALSRTMGVSALVSGVVIVPVVGRVAPLLGSVVLIALIAYLVICLSHGPSAHHELVATHHGRPVVLFESDDQREFDQVCRGLQRALEQHSY